MPLLTTLTMTYKQGSYKTSQMVFQDFPGPCTADRSTSFLTQSTLPLRHIVMEHCTNYYVILHLTYLL